MPGTRTAPTIDGTPDYIQVSVRYIDHTGDKRSVSFAADFGTTNAEIETLIAASQLGSNASIYEVRVNTVYPGAASPSNAIEEVWENVKDNIVLQMKDVTTLQSIRNYVPSPVNAWFVAGTEDVDTANAEFIAWAAASLATQLPNFANVGVRFTQRKDMNPSIPL